MNIFKKNQIILIVKLILILFFLLLSLYLYSNENQSIENHYKIIKNAINNPKKLNNIPKSFRIIALSFSSEGLKNYYFKNKTEQNEIIEIINKLTSLSISKYVSPYQDISSYNNFKTREYTLYLSHLNIILSNYYIITQNKKHYNIQQKINSYLVNMSLKNKDFHLYTYPGLELKYPADNSAVLYSVWLYDGIYKTNDSKILIKKWLKYMKNNYINNEYKLPVSEIKNKTWYSKYPRGCATPYFIYYMSFFAEKDAETYWKNFKKIFKGNFLGLTFFKEWIKNEKDEEYTAKLNNWFEKNKINGDYDTGPMLGEYGAAATGISLLAAKSVLDLETYKNVKNTLTLGYDIMKNSNKQFSDRLNNLLTISIIFTAETK